MHKRWVYGLNGVNYNWLTWILIYILKTYKTCNPMVKFLKYEFYSKLLDGVTLDGVTLLRVTSGVT